MGMMVNRHRKEQKKKEEEAKKKEELKAKEEKKVTRATGWGNDTPGKDKKGK